MLQYYNCVKIRIELHICCFLQYNFTPTVCIHIKYHYCISSFVCHSPDYNKFSFIIIFAIHFKRKTQKNPYKSHGAFTDRVECSSLSVLSCYIILLSCWCCVVTDKTANGPQIQRWWFSVFAAVSCRYIVGVQLTHYMLNESTSVTGKCVIIQSIAVALFFLFFFTRVVRSGRGGGFRVKDYTQITHNVFSSTRSSHKPFRVFWVHLLNVFQVWFNLSLLSVFCFKPVI